jgi:hypothetical protein
MADQIYVRDAFIVNRFASTAPRWSPPSSRARGWHVDGDSFRHFLDSPEQALVLLFHWTATHAGGGGTYIAYDSVPVVARFLASHPGGVMPNEFPYSELISQCNSLREVHAEAGDVLLLHPFTLHAASINSSPEPRVVTNLNIGLREPKNLARTSWEEQSPVERAILTGLGVRSFVFRLTSARAQFTSPRALQLTDVQARQVHAPTAEGTTRP